MAEAVTIKKKKLQIKSKKVAAAKAAEQDSESIVEDEALPGVFGRTRVEVEQAKPCTLYVVLAILALLMFIGILALQGIEWDFLSPAFPHPIQTGPVGP